MAKDANDILRENGEAALRDTLDRSEPRKKVRKHQRKRSNAELDAEVVELDRKREAAEAEISIKDFYAYLPQHNYIFAPTGDTWPATSVNKRLPAIFGGPDLKPIAPATWLDENRRVEQMTWAPGRPQLIKGQLVCEGGLIKQPDCSAFNLYKPPTIKPVAGNVTPWLELVHKVFPGEAEHIILWLAHRVQRPHEKVNHALVLGGKPGIGKDTILVPVREAVGPWNCQSVSPRETLGSFSGYLKAVILQLNEARDLGEFDRFKLYDHMKIVIASPPDVLRVNEKYLKEFYILNLCGVIITTNHKTDGIFLPADDRRHFVAWSTLEASAFAEDYWKGMYRWLETGGNERVAAYLVAVDLSSFDPKAPPRKTAAFLEIVNANRAPEDSELADVLDALETPDIVTLDQVAQRAETIHLPLAMWLRDRGNHRSIPHRFEDCNYVAVANPNSKDGRWKIKGERYTIYGKTSLTERDRIGAAFKFAGKR
jgi:hypothetical protein